MGNGCATHFLGHDSSQWGMCTEQTYNKLIELYKINEMEGFRPYKNVKNTVYKIKQLSTTYNPQKTKGKPYTVKGHKMKRDDYCGRSDVPTHSNENGDRYPTSILKYNQPKKSLHSTQKPIGILEWLIKTYSNDNEIVLDFTMGSGSTIEACMNTNRRYIGIEKDKDIYLVAKDRLNL
jgi:site-specific DNA-methyltransferase (adenine-specific)